MKFRNALVAMSILAIPSVALAQPVNGLYVGAGAGYDYLARQNFESLSVNGVPAAAPPGLKMESNNGWTIPVAVGYGFGNGVRVELEGMYLHVQQHLGGTGANGSGVNNTLGALVNAYYDFDIGLNWLYPYVGAGVGYTWTRYTGFNGTIPGLGAFSLSNHVEGSGAAQGILGVAFPISSVPGLSVTTEFRYLANFGSETFNGATQTGLKATLQYAANFQGIVGLRYAFNVAPPPPPPAPAPAPVAAPAPAPARTYLVFFDWDKADLTERAKQIIAEAAQNSTRVQVTRIEVNGYTDTSGSPTYNQKLSVKRAQNVAAELVRDGVPENEITVQGFGETHLLVPTGDNVREPQNRRVEIIYK